MHGTGITSTRPRGAAGSMTRYLPRVKNMEPPQCGVGSIIAASSAVSGCGPAPASGTGAATRVSLVTAAARSTAAGATSAGALGVIAPTGTRLNVAEATVGARAR